MKKEGEIESDELGGFQFLNEKGKFVQQSLS